MKVQLVFTVLMALFQCLPANATANFESPDCRFNHLEINYNISISTQLKKDLVSGIWKAVETPSKTTRTVHFHDYGIAEIITYDKGNFLGHELTLWSIEEHNGVPILVWMNTQMERENLMTIQQTCEGMVLTNVATNEVLSFDFKPKTNTKAKLQAESSLKGHWANATYPFDLTNDMDDCGTFEVMKGAYLNYKLNEDGTYEKVYGNAQVELKETGFWEVSEDGGFVIFLAAANGNPESIYHTSIAKIRHISIDELVLEQALSSHDFNDLFCTKIKTLAFVK